MMTALVRRSATAFTTRTGTNSHMNCFSFSSSSSGNPNLELHRPVGQDGLGEYSAATKGCFDVIAAATPSILSSIARIPLRSQNEGACRRVFTIADYGTADAGTSLGLVTKMVQAVRARGDYEIQIHYEDQRENEWRSVFNHALGHREVKDAFGSVQPPAYKEGNGVFISASGIGFHSQAYPSESLDFGMSFTAMHWLSRGPNSLRGNEQVMHSAQLVEPPQAEKEQAASDWLAILKARAKELRSGGRMVIVNFCKSKEGYFLGQTQRGVSMWDSFNKAWRRLYEEGFIDKEEATGVSFPNYYRTTADVVAGVEGTPGLKLLECEERIVPCPYLEQWLSGGSKRTPREHAEWFVPTTRSWSESTFKAALKGQPHRTEKERQDIMNKFWGYYVDLVEEDPASHHMDYVHTYSTIEKM